MFQRFTDRARLAMKYANEEALNLWHDYIGTEHILLGLVREGSGVGASVLKNLGIDLFKVRNEIEKLAKRGPSEPAGAKLPQTPQAKSVIELAIREARKLNHNHVGSEHLLLGLLAERDGVAAQVLKNLGLDLQTAREEIMNLLGAGLPPAKRTAEPSVPKVTSLCDAGLEPLLGALIKGFDKQLLDLTKQKDDLVRSRDYEKAADARDQAIALVQFKEIVIKKILDTPIDAASVARQPWGEHYARMLAQLTVALIETSPDLAAQLGDTFERLRKAAQS